MNLSPTDRSCVDYRIPSLEPPDNGMEEEMRVMVYDARLSSTGGVHLLTGGGSFLRAMCGTTSGVLGTLAPPRKVTCKSCWWYVEQMVTNIAARHNASMERDDLLVICDMLMDEMTPVSLYRRRMILIWLQRKGMT